jgi:hypothetical protein
VATAQIEPDGTFVVMLRLTEDVVRRLSEDDDRTLGFMVRTAAMGAAQRRFNELLASHAAARSGG